MRLALFMSMIFVNFAAFAKVSVMFHPYDPTLPAIAERIKKAKATVDIAMYNLDVSDKSPVIQALKTPKIQERLKSGKLKVRLIYEGYEEPEAKLKRMQGLEDLGVDVRYLGASKKVHHKFAVIDAGLEKASLITGSANWSLSSMTSYNENILFFDQEPGIARAFGEQFYFLWGKSQELGEAKWAAIDAGVNTAEVEAGLDVHFNTENFKFSKGKVSNNTKVEGYALTRTIVEAIDEAQNHIEIATTRVKLRPIYDALLRAAQRGVKVDLVVTMGEYEYKSQRAKKQVLECEDIYDVDCSAGQNYASFLSRGDFPGHENIQVRLKYFHVKKEVYLSKQMHSKYIIIDGQRVLTGSFNWSYSAEYNHLENLVTLDGAVYPQVVAAFGADFDRLWDKNREKFEPFLEKLSKALEGSYKIECGFEPIALAFEEVDYMLTTGSRLGKSVNEACKATSDSEKGTGEE